MSNTSKSHDDLSLKTGASGDENAADFSRVHGSASTVSADVTPSATEQTYTVQSGDTLSHIAKRFYGKAEQWQPIFEANRDQLDDPDLIQPGQVLKIPEAES